MQNALLSGLTGLRSNQRYLDVIGNNLANASTPGFKSSRITFVEVLGQTFRPGSGPTARIGGINPIQVGRGAQVGSIDANMIQGSLLSTGRNLDLGIQGEGFFILGNGSQDFYSRVGAFDLDASEYLVDVRTGFRVQSAQGTDIQIPLNSIVEPEASTVVRFSGNLPSDFAGPEAALLQTNQAFVEHHPARLAANSGPYDLTDGLGSPLTFDISVTVDFGTQQVIPIDASTFANPSAVTAQELADFLNQPGILDDAVAGVDGGTLTITSESLGAAASVVVDAPIPVGAILFDQASAQGTEETATSATDLNDLASNTRDYVDGDIIHISGMRPDGTSVAGLFRYGTGSGNDGVTLEDFVAKLNSMYQAAEGGATVTLDDATGIIAVEANEAGEASLTINISDDNRLNVTAGSTNWSNQYFRTIRQGTDADVEQVVTTVFDSTGEPHSVTFEFIRQSDGTWSLEASTDPDEGEVTSQPITGVHFDSQGRLNMVPGGTLDIQWRSAAGSQSVRLDFAATEDSEGLSQYGLPGSVLGLADGATAGALSSIGIRSDGVVEAFYTNGKIRDLERLGLALFNNPGGLERLGNGLWQVTSNSGEAFRTAAQEGSAGSMIAGSLESSNVDIAEEFVRLIEAQRAFQASARVISTTDEVLAELVNIV